MSIRSFLGFTDQPTTTGDTETVRKVVEALDHLEPERARFIAAFGYILGRVANADMKISPEETHAMERIIVERGGLPEEQALIVVQTAKTRTQLFGGTENFLVTPVVTWEAYEFAPPEETQVVGVGREGLEVADISER